ncbi:hypothetical protein [Vibrio gangliei]|uniref:hypothetical protein n=1 Tax=Vibrio gangliei TaxID=2077090 RepID=UPI000D012E6F|nr:hypothetical protein [Vibrio gangliei]
MKANLVIQHLITGIFEDLEKATISTSLGKRKIPATSFKRVSRSNKSAEIFKHIVNLAEFDDQTFEAEARESIDKALQDKVFTFPLSGITEEALYLNVRRAFSSVFEINKQIEFDLFDSLYRINMWKALESVNQEIYFNFNGHFEMLTSSHKLSGLLDCNTDKEELLGLDKGAFINTSFNREKNVGIPVSLYSLENSENLVFMINNEDQNDIFDSDGHTLNETLINTLKGGLKYKAIQSMDNLKVWVVVGHNKLVPRNRTQQYIPFCQMFSLEVPENISDIALSNLKEVPAAAPINAIFSSFSFFRKSMKLKLSKALNEVIAEGHKTEV